MKSAPLLLTVSVVANVALAAALLRAPSPVSGPAASTGAAAQSANHSAATTVSSARTPKIAGADALATTGPAADARDLALGRTLSRLVAQARAARPSDGRWWSNKGSASRNREDDLKAQRELSDAMVAAFGDDPFFSSASKDAQFAFLPVAKRDALRRITQDYDEMLAKFSANGIELASDREKQKLLRAERDIAALLSPDELAAYQMRTSTSAATIKSRYGDAIASEDEFAKIYALQKAFDDKFPLQALQGRISPDFLQARSAAERQLQTDLQAAVGNDRYAALRRATDSDLRTLDALAQRLNLPATTTDGIVAARDVYGAESQRINADPTLTPQQRRQQITDLGNRAKADLAATLGAEGADAYAQRSPWLSLLQGGTAFSNTPPVNSPGLSLGDAAQSVYPVLPAGLNATGGTAARQVFNVTSSSSSSSSSPSSDTLFVGSGSPVVRENVQVMTFSSATPVDSVAVPVAGSPGTAMVVMREGPGGVGGGGGAVTVTTGGVVTINGAAPAPPPPAASAPAPKP